MNQLEDTADLAKPLLSSSLQLISLLKNKEPMDSGSPVSYWNRSKESRYQDPDIDLRLAKSISTSCYS